MKYLSYVDFLAPTVGLNVDGKGKFKTALGGILSLCSLGTLIALAVVLARGYFNTTSPKIVSSTSNNGNFASVDIKATNSIPILYFSSSSLINSTDDLAKFVTINARLSGPDHQPFNDTIPLIMCRDLKARYDGMGKTVFFQQPGYSMDEQFYNNIISGNGVCFDLDNIAKTNLTGPSFAQTTGNYIWLRFTTCNSDKVSTCATLTEMASFGFTYGFYQPVVNLSNKDSPVSYQFNIDTSYYAIPSLYQKIFVRMSQSDIIDTRGDLWNPPKTTASYFTTQFFNSKTTFRDQTVLSATQGKIDVNQDLPYIEIYVETTRAYTQITREYQGVLSTLGAIGGNVGILMALFGAIYGFFHQGLLLDHLLGSIYGVESQGGKCACLRTQMNNAQGSGPSANAVKVDQEKSGQGKQMIEECLDLKSMVKEYNKTRMIVEVLVQDYQLELAPLFVLAANIKKAQASKDAAGKAPADQVGSIHPNSHVDDAPLKRDEWPDDEKNHLSEAKKKQGSHQFKELLANEIDRKLLKILENNKDIQIPDEKLKTLKEHHDKNQTQENERLDDGIKITQYDINKLPKGAPQGGASQNVWSQGGA